jgi:DNA-binding response OmpR family regulator
VRNKSILLVDPDEVLSNLVVDILTEEGYHVTAAYTLPEAMALLSSNGRARFDLVITEAFEQPMRFEFDPCFLAKLLPAAGTIPVALFSTYSSIDTIRAGDFGLADLLPKPFDLEDLVARVARMMEDSKPRKLKGASRRAVA